MSYFYSMFYTTKTVVYYRLKTPIFDCNEDDSIIHRNRLFRFVSQVPIIAPKGWRDHLVKEDELDLFYKAHPVARVCGYETREE